MSLSVDITKKLKDFSLAIQFTNADTTIGILGASGCGKSLTLKSIAGIITPDRGRIVLNDKVLFDSDKKINLPPQKRKVGYLFQSYALFPHMTVEQNISAGINGNKNDKQEKVKEMILSFCLLGLEKKYPHQLSGGQQQRVALARIIASETDILLLDEPFSALDNYLKEQMQEQLLHIIKDYKKDVIMVTHNRNEAFRFCQDIIILDNGHIVTKGKMKEIFENPTSVSAARLTGCKNISKAYKISDHEVYAIDWKINLQVDNIVSDQIGYVGIRAHQLKPIYDKDKNLNLNNCLETEFIYNMENPFEINLIFRNKNCSNENKTENNIWWKLGKEKWLYEYQEVFPRYIYFPSNSILLLEDC